MIRKIRDNSSKIKLVLIFALCCLILLIFRAKNHPDLVELYYSGTIYPTIRNGLQFIFNKIPFSAGDIFYILAILAIMVLIYELLKPSFIKVARKDIRRKIIINMMLNFEIALVLFYLFWALNYFRIPASERLGLSRFNYSNAELFQLTSALIDSANNLRSEIRPQQWVQKDRGIYSESAKTIRKLQTIYNPENHSAPEIKSSLFSPLMNYFGTAGYFNPFTGEAQVNSEIPVYLKAFVACHEMAHAIGYGREDEANFIGFISASKSQNQFVRYSAYYLAAQEFMQETARLDTIMFKKLKSKISAPFMADLKHEQAFWEQYRGTLRRFSSIFYDNYLKANEQPEGLKSYNRMIILTMAYYKKRGLLKTP
jgi:hypothetical protein